MPVLHAEMLLDSIREKLKQTPLEEHGFVICPVCERGFDPRGITPHMDAHRRAIGDLPARGKRGPNKSKQKKLRSVVVEQQPEVDLRTRIRQELKDRIVRIAELEYAAGIAEEYGPHEVLRLQAKRHGLEIAVDILEAL